MDLRHVVVTHRRLNLEFTRKGQLVNLVSWWSLQLAIQACASVGSFHLHLGYARGERQRHLNLQLFNNSSQYFIFIYFISSCCGKDHHQYSAFTAFPIILFIIFSLIFQFPFIFSICMLLIHNNLSLNCYMNIFINISFQYTYNIKEDRTCNILNILTFLQHI